MKREHCCDSTYQIPCKAWIVSIIPTGTNQTIVLKVGRTKHYLHITVLVEGSRGLPFPSPPLRGKIWHLKVSTVLYIANGTKFGHNIASKLYSSVNLPLVFYFSHSLQTFVLSFIKNCHGRWCLGTRAGIFSPVKTLTSVYSMHTWYYRVPGRCCYIFHVQLVYTATCYGSIVSLLIKSLASTYHLRAAICNWSFT